MLPASGSRSFLQADGFQALLKDRPFPRLRQHGHNLPVILWQCQASATDQHQMGTTEVAVKHTTELRVPGACLQNYPVHLLSGFHVSLVAENPGGSADRCHGIGFKMYAVFYPEGVGVANVCASLDLRLRACLPAPVWETSCAMRLADYHDTPCNGRHRAQCTHLHMVDSFYALFSGCATANVYHEKGMYRNMYCNESVARNSSGRS